MTPGASYCGVLGCENNSRKKPELTYFVVPREEDRKKKWVELIGRYDILDKSARTKYYVCSTHFSREMWNNKRLRPNAVPSIHLPRDSDQPSESLRNANIRIDRPKRSDQDCVENPDDPDDPDDDATIIIKEEIDDEIIKEEVDIEEQLARKRRQEEEMPSSSKKMRTDFPAENIPPQDPDTVGKESGKKETELLPEFFMTKMLNTQQEIIGILKNQVLLQDPDPALLTFLRFVGAKLQRLDELQRIELQDKITEMVIEY